MYQEEILKAIEEHTKATRQQTEAINRQTEALTDLIDNFNRYARNFEQVFGTGLEKSAAGTAALTADQLRGPNRNVRAETGAAQGIRVGTRKDVIKG